MKLRKVVCSITAALTVLSSMAIPARAENPGFTAEAKTSETTYNIIDNTDTTNGSVTILVNGVLATKAAEGDTVTVIVAPNPGYRADLYSLGGEGFGGVSDVPSNNEFSFTMQGCDMLVAVYFVDVNTPYDIYNCTDTTNGTVSIMVNGVAADKAVAGDTITVIANPNDGYKVDVIAVNKWDGSAVPVDINKFVMPEGRIDVNVTFVEDEKPTYNIKTDIITNGSISIKVNGVPATKAAEGDIVTIIAAPNPGYKVLRYMYQMSNLFTSCDCAGINEYEFIMPGEPITVYVNFVKAEKYNIKNGTIGNGTVSFEVDGKAVVKAAQGDTVTVVAAPNSGYKVDVIAVKKADGSAVPVGINEFIMPEGDVTVNVTFVDVDSPGTTYNIKTGTITNGSVSFKIDGKTVTKAAKNDQVTIIAAPNAGYKVGEITVNMADGSSFAPEYGGSEFESKFIMPEEEVTVNVTFVEADPPGTTYNIKIDTIANGSVSIKVNGVAADKAAKGDTVTVIAAPNSGYKGEMISYITGNMGHGVSINNNVSEFEMPGEDITITAYFVKIYNIKKGTLTNCSASFMVNGMTVDKAKEGDIVRLVIEPSNHSRVVDFETITVKKADGSVVTVDGAEFRMPGGEVTVDAAVTYIDSSNDGPKGDGSPEYKIEKGTITNGSVSFMVKGLTATKAMKDDYVSIFATPNYGYTIGTITVKKADGTSVATYGGYTFQMPGEPVTVTVSFTKMPGYEEPSSSSSGSASTNAEISSAIGSVNKGGTVKVDGTVFISADIVKSAGDKNVKLEVKVDGVFTWNIDAGKVADTYFPLILNVNPAAVDTAQTAKIKRSSAAVDRNEMSFTTSAANLGSGAALNVKTSVKPAANVPQFANLYKTKSDGTLEFTGVAPIDANGNAVLPIEDAGTYTIVTSTETKLIGDVDNSCHLSITDVSAALKELLNAPGKLTGAEYFKLDINNDNQVTIGDVAELLRYYLNGCK